MGGHQTKQTVTQISNTVSKAVFDQLQKCASDVSSYNHILINNAHNAEIDVTQHNVIHVTKKCVQDQLSNSQFTAKLSDAVGQSLTDKQIALTGFLDASHNNIKSHINNNVTQTTVHKAIQDCTMNLVNRNDVDLKGIYGGVIRIDQSNDTTMLSNCFQTSKNVADMSTNISNAVNQTAKTISKNPFAFITDAISSIMSKGIYIGALLIIAIVVFVVLYKVFRRRHPEPQVIRYISTPEPLHAS